MISWILLSLGVFVLDLATKSLVRAHLPVGSDIRLLPFFSLTHVKNTGIAFGMFQGRNYFFVGMGAIVAGLVIYFAFQLMREDRFSSFVLAGVLGGALGNLTDRIVFGQVTDFLDFYIGSHHWPAFNIADSAVCVGAALLLWRSFMAGYSKANPNDEFPISKS